MTERGSAFDDEARAFAAEMARREKAAKGLKHDLLTEVPMLYGSPGRLKPQGDPGIVLAELHRAEMVRRNGGGLSPSPPKGRAWLPFERALIGLAVVLMLVHYSRILD